MSTIHHAKICYQPKKIVYYKNARFTDTPVLEVLDAPYCSFPIDFSLFPDSFPVLREGSFSSDSRTRDSVTLSVSLSFAVIYCHLFSYQLTIAMTLNDKLPLSRAFFVSLITVCWWSAIIKSHMWLLDNGLLGDCHYQEHFSSSW